MAVLFSAVTVTAGEEAELLVSGITREYDDLEGWTIFDDFLEDISEETQVHVHAEAYPTAKKKPTRRPRKKWHTSQSGWKRTNTSSVTTATASKMWTSASNGRRTNYLEWR